MSIQRHLLGHIPWHGPSDQPARIEDRHLRRLAHWKAWDEYLHTAWTSLTMTPLVAWRYRGIDSLKRSPGHPRDFIGLGVSPHQRGHGLVHDLVQELGVRHLLIRIPVWERDQFQRYRDFIAGFPGCTVTVAILQERASVIDIPGWERDLTNILERIQGLVRTVQIGQCGNRLKWGCFGLGDHARLAEASERVRQRFPGISVIGPALIDFEPLVMIRALINGWRVRYDRISALLYVDRRGPPTARQYRFFDLQRKIRTLASIASLSPHCPKAAWNRIWITEVNWPLKGTGEAAPTGEAERIGEEDQGHYLRAYYQQAYASSLVERVYWWQLIAHGYGLVDDQDGIRRRPAFTVLRRLLDGGIPLGGEGLAEGRGLTHYR